VIEALQRKCDLPKHVSTEIRPSIGEESYLPVFRLLLAIREHGVATVDFILVSHDIAQVMGIDCNLFPTDINGAGKNWVFIDKERTCARFAAIARIQHEGWTRYLLEIQHRVEGECSTLVFWRPGGEEIGNGEILAMFMECMRARGANLGLARDFGIAWGRLRHTTEFPSDLEHAESLPIVKHFLGRIFGANRVEREITPEGAE
jgi:hypothetical protein